MQWKTPAICDHFCLTLGVILKSQVGLPLYAACRRTNSVQSIGVQISWSNFVWGIRVQIIYYVLGIGVQLNNFVLRVGVQLISGVLGSRGYEKVCLPSPGDNFWNSPNLHCCFLQVGDYHETPNTYRYNEFFSFLYTEYPLSLIKSSLCVCANTDMLFFQEFFYIFFFQESVHLFFLSFFLFHSFFPLFLPPSLSFLSPLSFRFTSKFVWHFFSDTFISRNSKLRMNIPLLKNFAFFCRAMMLKIMQIEALEILNLLYLQYCNW